MPWKAILILGGVSFAGAYSLGGFMPSYSRLVERSPAVVAQALEDLDFAQQPGAPTSDPGRSGGVRGLIRHDRTADGVVWTVMSGDRVAARLYANLSPVEKTGHTRVTTRFERGDAPDDVVTPVFRSKGTGLALFSLAVDAELDELTLPSGDPAKCAQILDRWADRSPSADMMRQDGLKDAMADTASAIAQIGAMEMELRNNGCATPKAGDEFHSPKAEMRMR